MIHKLHQYHLVRRLRQQVSDRSELVAFREWSPEGEKQLNWQQIDEHVTRISTALLSLGAAIQERIGIFANNSMAWSLVDLAILQLRGVSVPLYATNTAAQAAYIVNDADVRICLSVSNPNLILPSRCNLSARNWLISSSWILRWTYVAVSTPSIWLTLSSNSNPIPYNSTC